MLAAILIGATLGGEPTVTFTHPCAHSSVILRALGEEIGMTLRPRGTVDKDYFLVRFDDLPVEEALDRIAETLNATWIGEGKVRYLDRTDEDLREELETVFQIIDKFLEDNPLGPYPTVQELVPQLAGIDNLEYTREADREKYISLGEFSPLRRALIRVLKSFSKDDIFKMSAQDDLEYFARPFELERPFTKPMVAALHDMLDEYEVLQEAAERAGVPQGKQYLPGFLKLVEPGKLENANFGFVVELADYGFTVRLLASPVDSWIGIESIKDSLRQYRKPPYPELEGTNVPYVGRPEHLAFFKSLLMREYPQPSNTFNELPKWTQTALLDLERYEPLGMHQSDVLLQLAELKGWDMVALLDDGELIPLFSDDQAKDLREEIDLILWLHDINLDEDSLFVSISPQLPKRTRQGRWDRRTISQAIRRSKSFNWFDLEAEAMLVGTYPGGLSVSGIEDTLTNLFENRLAGLAPRDLPGGLLALYASLPETFRQEARLGPVKAPAATMDENVRNLVRSALGWGWFREEGFVSRYADREWSAYVFSGDIRVPEQYYSGPIPLDVLIELNHETRHSFIAEPLKLDRGGILVSGLISVDQFASAFLSAQESGSKLDYLRVMVVPSEKLTIKISLPGLEYGTSYVTSGAALTGGFVTHNRLPPALRTELRQAIARQGG
ncbi:MAG: hypothetical protein IH944_03370 [Armatimonadetes bacterium]|nr:hypothetical protein [Armatimonadota bacterium]